MDFIFLFVADYSPRNGGICKAPANVYMRSHNFTSLMHLILLYTYCYTEKIPVLGGSLTGVYGLEEFT